MSKNSKFFSKVALLLLILTLLLSNGSVVKANPTPTIQIPDTPLVHEESRNHPNTGSAGIAWADPDGPHSTYTWPHEFAQMGHLISSYQNYYENPIYAYFHHGIDMVTPTHGVPVYTRTGGQVVNVENYDPGHSNSYLYWEVAILDPEGYVWQFHHVDNTTIPQEIHNAYQAYLNDPDTGGFVDPNTYIGGIVNWPVESFGYFFHHIHLNILAAGDIYINPLEFHEPGNYVDTQDPVIHEIGLLNGNTPLQGNTVSKGTAYSLYLKASDLYMSEVYYLPPHKIEFMLDGSGEWISFWDFHTFPGGSNTKQFVNDFFIPGLTKGNYENRQFYINLGFTTEGLRAFPDEPGMHTIDVRVWDYAGNSDEASYTWFVTESIPDNGCLNRNGITKTFQFTKNRFVEDIDVKVMLAHEKRGQIWLQIKAPGDVQPTFVINSQQDTKKNFNVTINDNSTEPLHNGQDDIIGEPLFGRLAGPSTDNNLAKYFGRSARGEWTLFVCDNGSGVTGELIDLDLKLYYTNYPPAAGDQVIYTGVGRAVHFILSGMDPDGDEITFRIITGPQYGEIETNLPNVTYTPNPGFYGEDSITFVANDGEADSMPATITILVRPMIFFPVITVTD